jgi:MurNAc alpha-1-phosphate uridylyltransferase
MKAMILAAGRGERLRPLTDKTPKPLLKAGPHRLIEYLIMALVDAGFKEIVINHAHLGEQFPKILGNGQQYGAQIEYSVEEYGLETAGGIINALPLLGDEPFLVVNGDIWTQFPFSTLKDVIHDDLLCHLVLVNNPEHHPLGDFGLRSGKVLSESAKKYTFSGIAVYHPRFFAGYKVEKLPLKPLLMDAIERQAAAGEFYAGEWSDIGTVERLQSLEAALS